ncbi:MAG: hypothetical protein ABUL63_01735, partial [Acidobacteriota bacterium]
MAVTRSTAAERRQRNPAVAGMSGGPRSGRSTETLLLAGGALAVLFGLVLVYLAVTKPLADIDKRLATGDVVAINEVRNPDQILPLLGFLDEPAER